MIEILSEFFGIIGLDISVPETLSELIPYLLNVLLGVGLILFILKMIRYWGAQIFGGRMF